MLPLEAQRLPLGCVIMKGDGMSCVREETPFVIISVVRDFSMYDKTIKSNPACKGGKLVVFDNRHENEHISTRYNSFLENWNYSQNSWFIFVHEDLEFMEDVQKIVENMDSRYIYGCVGVTTWRGVCVAGEFYQSLKNGQQKERIGKKIIRPQEVATTDCCCMFVHSSLVSKYSLRFDSNLSFDFYIECFQINAREKYNISTYVYPVAAWHFSEGKKTLRFYRQRGYLRKLFNKSNSAYRTTTCEWLGATDKIIKKAMMRKFLLWFDKKLKRMKKWIVEINRINGRLIIKIFRISIWRGKKCRDVK